MAYKAVEAGHKDQFAFDLLSNILSEGTSSRLYKKLVYNEQVATSVYSYAYTPANKGVFNISTTLKAGGDPSRIIKMIQRELTELQNNQVEDKELEKAKNQVVKAYVDSLKTISGKARSIASNQILFGDYKVLFSDINKYLAVSKEDIQRVAREYLGTSKRSIIKVLPAAHKTKTAMKVNN